MIWSGPVMRASAQTHLRSSPQMAKPLISVVSTERRVLPKVSRVMVILGPLMAIDLNSGLR